MAKTAKDTALGTGANVSTAEANLNGPRQSADEFLSEEAAKDAAQSAAETAGFKRHG